MEPADLYEASFPCVIEPLLKSLESQKEEICCCHLLPLGSCIYEVQLSRKEKGNGLSF